MQSLHTRNFTTHKLTHVHRSVDLAVGITLTVKYIELATIARIHYTSITEKTKCYECLNKNARNCALSTTPHVTFDPWPPRI